MARKVAEKAPAAKKPVNGASAPPSCHIHIQGREITLLKRETEILVHLPGPSAAGPSTGPGSFPSQPLSAAALQHKYGLWTLEQLTSHLALIRIHGATARDELMDDLRQTNLAHHVYQRENTGERVLIHDRLYLTLHSTAAGCNASQDTAVLNRLISSHRLRYLRPMGDAHLLQVTTATGKNAIATCAKLMADFAVAEAHPEILLEVHRQGWRANADSLPLYPHQWPVNGSLLPHPNLALSAGIRVQGAWDKTTGDPAVVVAVLDDGFDLKHPAFVGTRIHPEPRDFGSDDGSSDVSPQSSDYHGTAVASIIFSSPHGGALHGIAPHCTFLPVRLEYGLLAPSDLVSALDYISARADVVNCSFCVEPSTLPLPKGMQVAINDLARKGGRHGKGLVIVMAAGNDDAPTHLPASDNLKGLTWYQRRTRQLIQLPPETEIFTGCTAIPDALIIAASTSLGRKAAYSNWGPHITLCAPSDNWHGNLRTPAHPPAQAELQAPFLHHYRGLGIPSAVNRPTVGRSWPPPPHTTPSPPGVADYTCHFGGTSASAAQVAGVAALVLSANPHLTAAEVKDILVTTASTHLSHELDATPQADPNHQGIAGRFDSRHSPFFGAGRVNATFAVLRARQELRSNPQYKSLKRPAPPRLASSRLLPIPLSIKLTGPDVFSELLSLAAEKVPGRNNLMPLTPLWGCAPALFSSRQDLYRWTHHELSVHFDCKPCVAYGQNFTGNTIAELATAIYLNRLNQ